MMLRGLHRDIPISSALLRSQWPGNGHGIINVFGDIRKLEGKTHDIPCTKTKKGRANLLLGFTTWTRKTHGGIDSVKFFPVCIDSEQWST